MKKQLRSLWRTACTVTLGLAVAGTSLFAQTSARPASTSETKKPDVVSTAQANAMLSKASLEFVENKGQVFDDKGTARKDIKFTASSNNTKIYMFPDKLSYVFTKVDGVKNAKSPMDMDMSNAKTTLYRMDMELVGANSNAVISPSAMLPGVSNFYNVASVQGGISGVHGYGKLVYENVYPNIDMVLVSKGKGLKAEFIVRPGGNPSLIKMKFNGADDVALLANGGMKVTSPLGTITEETPYSYVTVDGKQQEVAVTFNVDGSTVGFTVPDYDKTQTLVIDPQRDWSTLSGGTNTDIATAVAVQQFGSGAFATLAAGPAHYIVGHTISTNYPTTGGAFQTALSGTRDCFVSGFTYGAVGGTTARTFSTYFGGTGDDMAFGVAVDNTGNIFVVGETTSPNGTFATGSAFDNTFNSSSNTIPDAFIATFTSAGARTACSYFGGNSADRLQCITIDVNNIVTVGGYTASTGLVASYGTPTTVWQPNRNGIAARHGLLARFPAGSSLTSNPTWLTYYGTGGLTQVRSVAHVNSTGAVWVGGSTTSPDSVATAGSFNTVWNNNGSGTTSNFSNDDGFAARFNTNGQLDGATFVGSTNNDGVYGVAHDWTVAGNTSFAVAGVTFSDNSSNIMASAGAISSTINSTGTVGLGDGLIWQLQWNGTSPNGSINRTFGTYWGLTGDDYLTSITIDSNVNVTAVAPNTVQNGTGAKYIVAGATNDAGFAAPYNMMAGFATGSGGYDAAYSRLRSNGTNFVEEMTAFMGGTGNDEALGLAVDAMRNSTLAGSTIGDAAPADLGSAAAPQTVNANTSAHDAFLFKLCDLIVPNQPLLSNVATNGVGVTTGLNVCIDTNTTATGSASTGAGSGSPACLSDARNQVFIKITNAVQGVTYTVRNVTSGTVVTTVLATVDQHLVIDISSFLSNGAIFPGMAPNTSQTYNLRIDASTPSNCLEQGAATSPITIFQLPNNSITQTTPAANAPANLGPAPFSNQNFFGCTTGNNVYQVTSNAGHTYSWCVYPTGLTSSVSGNATNAVTVGFVDVAVATTCTLRVRETNTVSGCAKEYVAFVRLLPLASMTVGGANGATGVTYNSGLSTRSVNGTFFCSSETGRFDNSSIYTTTGYTVPAENLSTFWWTAGAPTGMAAPTFSASTVAPGTNGSGTTNATWNGPFNANPATVTLTLNSRNTSVGIGPTCDRTNVNQAVQIFPQPVITSVVQSTPASPTNVCEGTAMTYTVTVTYPGGAAFASQPITWNAIINRTNLTGGTASPLSGSTTTTAGGTFTISVANVGTVSSAYDNFGQINLGVTVTNAATNAPANCTSALVNSAEVNNVTQPPDQKSLDLTILTTTPVTGGTAPFNTILSALPNALPLDHSQACLYTANPNGVQQEYTYQVVSPNNGTVNPGGDYYDWTVSGTAGVDYTLVAGGDGIASTSIVLRWLTAGAKTISVVQQNDQDPATGGGPYANSCNMTHTTFNVTVNNIPSAPTMSWAVNSMCENTTATLNITGGPANGRFQVYGIQLGAATNVLSYTNASYPGSAPFSPSIVTLNASGAGSFTFNTGIVNVAVPAGPAANQQLQLVIAVASDVNSQCVRTNILTPTITVWDTPQPVILTPNVPLAGNNPTPVCPNMTTGPQANVIIPPAVAPAPYTYSVSNLASYPAGTSFAWTLRDNADATNLTPATDYTISLSSSGGFTNNIATVTFGANLSAQPNVNWRVIATIPPGCVSPATPVAQTVNILAVPTPNIVKDPSDGNSVAVPGPYCSNATYSFMTANTAPNTFAWSVVGMSGGPAASVSGPANNNSVNINFPAFNSPAHHYYRLIVVETHNLTGCQQADTQYVDILPVPNATITHVNSAIGPCIYGGENAHIAVYTVPKDPSSYTIASVAWSITGGAGMIYGYTTSGAPGTLAGANDTVRIQWGAAGASQIQAIVTTTGGCTTTGTFNTFVYPPANPIISGPVSVCKFKTGGASPQATYNVNPVVTGDNYIWEIIPSTGGTFTTPSSGVDRVTVGINWDGPANTVYTLRCTQVSTQGCTARTPVFNVTVNPNPVPNISGPSTICANQSYTFTTQNNSPSNSYAWSFTANTAGASFVSGQNTATTVVTTTSTGAFTLRVDETVVATSCTDFNTKAVTVQTAPTPTINRTDLNPIGIACVGQTLNYGVTPAVGGRTYAWSVTGGGTVQGASNLNNVNILWNTTGNQTITLTETINATSCSTTVTQAVNVVNVPAPNISGPLTVCRGGATPLLQYTYTTTNNAGNTYAWTLPANVTAVGPTNSNSITVTYASAAAASVTLSVTETNASNCATTATLNVATTARPNPVIQTAPSTAVCQNSTGNTYNVTATRIAGSTLNWTVAGGTITAGQNTDVITVTWTTAGNQTISVTETNGACTASNATPYTVVVNPAPTAFNVVPSTASTCVNTGYQISLNGSQSTPATTYQLVENGSNLGAAVAGTGGAINFPTITKGTAGTFSYTVVATATGTGCTATMTGAGVVTVNPLPTPAITQTPNPVCAGSSVVFSTPTAAGRTYVWTVPSGYTITSGSGTASITCSTTSTTTAGTITVAETITATGCSATANFTSVVTPATVVQNVTPATAQVCRPNTGTTTFNVQLSGSQSGVSYQVMNGASPVGSAVSGTGSALTLPVTIGTGGNIVNTGTYTLTVNATGSAPCNTPVAMNGSVALTVNPTPTPAIAGNATVCTGSTQTYSTTNNAGSTYAWTVPSGWTVTAGAGTSSITVTVGTTTGAQTISVLETVSATTCNATATFNVTVTATPTPTITGSTTVCGGSTTTYTTASGAGSYTWTVTGAGGNITSGQGTNSISVQWGTGAGTANVAVAVTTNGCTGNATSTITVIARPVVNNVSTTAPNICATTPTTAATITVSGSQVGVNYVLYRNGGVIGSAVAGTGNPLTMTDNTHSGTAPYVLNYTVKAISTAAPCNTSSDTVVMNGTATITVNPLPNVTISGNTTVCQGSSQVYSVPSAGNQTYNWTVPTGWTVTAGAGTSAITATVGATGGNVSVTVTNTLTSCSNSNSVAVTVTSLPTAFNVTPAGNNAICLTNAAGTNNTYQIGLSGSQTGTNYQLFNGTNAVSTPVAGTGAALSPATWLITTTSTGTFTYTIQATSTACSGLPVTMTGSSIWTVNPNPAPAITGSNNVCASSTITYSTPANTGSNYSWTITGGTPTTATTSSVTVTWGTGASGTVVVTETISATGCARTTPTMNVTINALPTPTITGNATVCVGTTQTYSTGTFATYNWTVPTGGNITSGAGTNTIQVAWTAAGSQNVNLTVTNAANCSGSTTLAVTVSAQPTAFNVSPATQTICNATPVAQINLSGSQTGVTYELRENGVATVPVTTLAGTGAGLTFSRTVPAALRSTLPANISYTIVATGTGGCTNNMNGSALVTVIANPTPTVTGPAAVCIGSTGTYTVTPVNAGSTYQWNAGGNTVVSQTANQATIAFNTTTGSPFTISVIETNSGCTGNASTTTVVNALPVAQTMTVSPASATICAAGGSAGTNTATLGLSTTQSGFTYNLRRIGNTNIISSITGNGAAMTFPVISGLAAGSYGYTVEAISNTTPACTTAAMSNNITLTVVANPTPAITGPNSPCQNATVTYQTTNVTGNTYAWSITSGAGTFVGPTNTYQANVQWTATGAGTIQVTESNSVPCSQVNSYNVTVVTAPTPTISASIASPVCGGATVTYTTPSISGATYNWVLGSGGTISSGQGSNSIVVNWANATPDVAYASTVQVTVNNGGCTGSATSNITVNPKANPSLTGDAARCHGQSGTYTTPFVVNGRSYTWTLVNAPTGSVFAANNGTTFTGLNANSVVVNWANTGTAPVNATVQVVETPAVGSCTGTSTFNVTVNPLPVVTISGPAQVCQNTTVAYNATPAQTGLSYAWNVTGATSWSGQGTGTINVTWGTANGVISLTATNNGTSCTNTATNNNFAVAVTLNPQPAIATPPGTTACAGSTLTYSVQNPQVGLTYTWSNTGATSATVLGGGTQYQVTWTNLPGNGSITLTAATSGGVTCTGSITRNITIAPNPTPSITGATAVCPNVDQTYSTPFQSGDTYQWTLPAGTFQVTGGSLTGNTVTVRWNQVATPTVRAVTVLETTQNGCTGTASVNVTVNPAPTPNISGNTNVCAYIGAYDGITTNNTQTYTVTNPVNAGSSFQWSIVPSSAGVFTGASSGVGVTTVTIQWNEPTTASTITNVLRVVETANGVPTCSGQTDLNVTVNWNPKPVISGARVWCDNTPYVANSTNAAQSGFATYSVTVPTTPPLTGGQVRNYVWTVTPSTAGSVVSGQGTNQVQVTWLNATNSPANAVLSVTETITYPGTGLTPATQFCPQTDTFRVTINPIPKPVISPATVDNCGRYGVTYSTTNVGGNTYAWTVNNGIIVGTATANSVNVIWNDVATDDQAGFVQVTETISATGCTTTIRQNTLIDHTPVPVIQGPSTLCQQTTNGTNIGVYQAVNADGGLHTQRSYAWSIVSPTTGPVTLTGVASNNLGVNDRYTVTVNGNTNVPVTAVIRLITTSTTSTIGCNDDTTFTITINPNPTPVITSNTGGLNTNGVCAGSSHTYQTALVTGNNYSWTVAGGTIVGTNNTNVINVTWGPAGPGSVSVRETVGATGCYTDVTANVTIRPLPIPDLTNQTGGFNRPQVCAQSTTNYRTTDNTANGNTYAWAVTGGTIASGQGTPQIAVTWGAAGAGTVKVTETTPASQGSCSDSRTLNVTINPLPTPVISGPPAPPVCINSVQTYSTPNVAGNTYLWSVTGGVIQGANSNNTVSVRWNVAGNGTISVLETITATGCQQTATRTIVVNPLPVVTITPSGRTDLCTGQSVTLTATAGFVSYTWNTGETTPSITVSQAGTYSVTVTDGNGCVGTSTTITVTVQNRAKPVIQASGPTVICEGQSVTLTATQATWATAYRWSTGATTPQITVTKSGFYSVEASDGTCKATSDEVEVRVSPAPTVSITSNVPTNTICEGGSLTLDAGVHAEYDWKRNGTSVGSNRTITITQVAQAGSYTVTVKNSAGCPAISTPVVVKVNPNPSPVIDDGGKKQFCAGDSTTLDAGPGFSSYLWSNSATTRRITVKSGGTYTVQVTDTNGCNGQSQPLTVTVFPTPPKPTLTRTGNTLTSSVAQSYVWYRNGSVISGSTGQSVDATSIGDGYYKVTITDVNGCVNTSDSIQVIRVGVEDPIADAFGLKFSPNPTNGNVTMQLNLAQDQPNAVVTVRNLIGSEVMSINLDNITTGETNKALDLTSLPNGTYYVEVRLANGVRMTGRITKVD